MAGSKVRITFKHYRTQEELSEVGTLPSELNNPKNDRFVLLTDSGKYIDIIKETVTHIELGVNKEKTKVKIGCRSC